MTIKKVKYIGTQQFIDANTGEYLEFNVTNVEERDFNFKKVWMRDFLNSLDIIGNQKTKIAYWIIDNIKSDNTISFTYDELCKWTNTSIQTVSFTVNLLINANFMKKVRQAYYHINPSIIFKGDVNKRLYNLNIYNAQPKYELTKEEKLKNLINSIEQLTKQAKELQKELEQEKTMNENQIELEIAI